MVNKEIITLIGIGVTIIIGLLNLEASKSNRFISSINAERLKWINNVREVFSQFNKNCYIYANAVIDARHDNGEEVTEEEAKKAEHTFQEILYYLDLIKLYTNPTEILSAKLYLAIDDMVNELKEQDFNTEKYGKIKENIHYYQQVILKAEWKRMKEEAKLGRELDDKEINEIFKSTSIQIDKQRYSKFLKEKFESQVNEE
ncbi:hypothetical protein M1D53_11450 [Bacillus sp. PK9-021]|uniref:hypothetical protein n=1 Tax=Priestia megaterium TaxID=1404 RepID=UPI003CC5A151